MIAFPVLNSLINFFSLPSMRASFIIMRTGRREDPGIPVFLPSRKNLWVTGALRAEPGGKQQPKKLPNTRSFGDSLSLQDSNMANTQR